MGGLCNAVSTGYNQATGQQGSAADNFLSAASNFLTAGIAQYTPGKGLQPGLVAAGGLRAVNEGIGEVTGRNAGRDATAASAKAANDAAASQSAEIAAEQEKKHQQALSASNTAGALKTAAANKQSQLTAGFAAIASNKNYNPSQDFLGL